MARVFRYPRRTVLRSSLTHRLLVRAAEAIAALGIVLLATFLLLEAMPGDRALVEAAGSGHSVGGSDHADPGDVRLLRIRYGALDPDTNEVRPLHSRFVEFLRRVVTFDLAPLDESPEAFRSRLFAAFSVSVALGGSAICLAVGVGILLGAFVGARPGHWADVWIAGPLAAIPALPGALLATLAVLAAPVLGLPTGGLGCSSGSETGLGCALVLTRQLLLPVALLAVGPMAVIMRHVRDAMRTALESPPIDALRGFGIPISERRERAQRASLAPVATMAGLAIPAVASGSVVVENVFVIPGVGSLAHQAILRRDDGTVLAITIVIGVLVVFARLLSDLLHRALDPRVRA